MVEKLMVEVYLPAAGRTFEVRLPAGLRIRAAGMLLSMLLSEATDGLYQPSRSGVLMWRDSGRMLSGQKTLWESGIQNGSRLMLIEYTNPHREEDFLMAGRFAVDPAQLEQTARYLQDASESYQRIYNQLISAAESMGASYDSEDNRVFVCQIQSCTVELQNMAERLSKTAGILLNQKANYEKQTEANVAAARRL